MKLQVATQRPDERVIDALRKALQKAEDGDLRSVAIVGNLKGGNFYSAAGWSKGESTDLLGQLVYRVYSNCQLIDEDW